jgi:hypothetical protein
MKKNKHVLLASIIVGFMMQSCSVMRLSYNSAVLTDDISYRSWELHGSSYIKKTPLKCDLSVGYGGILRSSDWDSGSFSDADEAFDQDDSKGLLDEGGLLMGVTPVYYLSSARLQPFVACNLTALLTGSSQSNYYLSTTPSAGLRFFFSNKFAISGSYGYQWGKLDFGNGNKNVSGTSLSLGLTLTL